MDSAFRVPFYPPPRIPFSVPRGSLPIPLHHEFFAEGLVLHFLKKKKKMGGNSNEKGDIKTRTHLGGEIPDFFFVGFKKLIGVGDVGGFGLICFSFQNPNSSLLPLQNPNGPLPPGGEIYTSSIIAVESMPGGGAGSGSGFGGCFVPQPPLCSLSSQKKNKLKTPNFYHPL